MKNTEKSAEHSENGLKWPSVLLGGLKFIRINKDRFCNTIATVALIDIPMHSHDIGQSENGKKCDGSKILATVHTIPAQFDNDRNLTAANSLKSADGKEMYLHLANRPA